ncbi:hypothetical protein [Nonomuraea jabiensis]|uniref:hypothetical protein n=1 Tax=Nonomuraea jabiensis TaxID=882448 RepID=UPI003D750DC0
MTADGRGESTAPLDVERAGAGELFNLVVDIGPVPMQVGARLVLDAGLGFEVTRAAADR